MRSYRFLLIYGFAFLCALITETSALAGVNSWTTSGPPGGSFRFLVPSPTNADILYAAYNRSLHKSSDGGATWQTIREFTNQVTVLVVDPADGNRIYVGAINDGLFRSEDGGVSFTQIVASSQGLLGQTESIAGLSISGSTVYYCTISRSFYRSTDRGTTWVARTSPPQILSTLLADAGNANSIFGFAGPFMIRSTDGGVSWAQTNIVGDVSKVVMLSPSILVGAGGSGVYRTTDGGTNWSKVLNGFFGGLALNPNAAGTLIASPARARQATIYRSTDYGATWNEISAVSNGPGEGLVVSGASSSRMAVVNSTGARYSQDAGVSWKESTKPPIASAATFFAGMATSKLYAFSSGALYSTLNDSGWQRLNLAIVESMYGSQLGAAAFAVKPSDPNALYIAPFGGNMYRSLDGGATWSVLSNALAGFSVEAIAFDPSNEATMYAKVAFGGLTPSSGLYRSKDGGSSWSPMGSSLAASPFGRALIVDPSNSKRLFLGSGNISGGTGGGFYVSTDEGITWSQSLANQNVSSVAVSPVNSNNIYVAASGGLQVSTDGGLSFSANVQYANTTTQAPAAVVIDPLVPTTLYVASQSYVYPDSAYLLRSVDSGQSWEVLRRKTDAPWRTFFHLMLDPGNPSLLYVDTIDHGTMAFEVVPDLRISISGHSGKRSIGDQSSFDIRTENVGPYASTNAKVTATLPLGISALSAVADRGACNVVGTTITCIRNAQAVGEVTNIHVVYTPSIAMLLTVSAALSAHERDSDGANNSVEASAIAGEVSDLSVTANPSATKIDNGDTLSYSVQVGNNGPANLVGGKMNLTFGVGLTFGALPAGCVVRIGAVTCDIGALPTATNRSFEIVGTASSPGTIATFVNVTTDNATVDLSMDNNAVNTTTTVTPVGDLSLVISDSADPVAVGANFDYRVTVRNLGPDSVPNVVATLIDTGAVVGVTSSQGVCLINAANVVCSLGTLAAGASITITATTNSSSPRSVSLQASVTSGGTDRVVGNNSAQEFTVVNAVEKSGGGGGGGLDMYWLALSLLLLSLRCSCSRSGTTDSRFADASFMRR